MVSVCVNVISLRDWKKACRTGHVKGNKTLSEKKRGKNMPKVREMNGTA